MWGCVLAVARTLFFPDPEECSEGSERHKDWCKKKGSSRAQAVGRCGRETINTDTFLGCSASLDWGGSQLCSTVSPGQDQPRETRKGDSQGWEVAQWQPRAVSQNRLTGRGRTHQRWVKSKICIYRISSFSSAGWNPIIKIQILRQKTWLGTMLQTGNHNVACGTRESLWQGFPVRKWEH